MTVSDLAEAAGVARGTVYNNFKTIESLFEDVATELTREMQALISARSAQMSDPAERLTCEVASSCGGPTKEHIWGRYLVRFPAPPLRPWAG